MMNLETQSLRLVPNSPDFFLALIDGEDKFEQTAGYRPGDGLRNFIVSDDVAPEFTAALRGGGEPDPWKWGFIVVHKPTDLAIGTAGFKGPPDGNGMVEIAYGIVPSFQNRGYATIVARTLVDFACGHPAVKSIRAHTLPVRNASTRVLEKNGFIKTETVQDPDDGEVWRWQLGEIDA